MTDEQGSGSSGGDAGTGASGSGSDSGAATDSGSSSGAGGSGDTTASGSSSWDYPNFGSTEIREGEGDRSGRPDRGERR
jgi:hypothetical protein